MAATSQFSLEEGIGLGVAAALHVALALLLIFGRPPPEPIPAPERIVVSLAEEVGPVNAAPVLAPEAAAAVSPTLSDIPEPERVVESEAPVQPTTRTPPPPPERQSRQASPRERQTQPPPRRRDPAPQPRASNPPPQQAPPQRRSGTPRMGDDFVSGMGDSESASADAPATEFGAAELASFESSIRRQLRPHWSAPRGLDVEQLITVVRIRLNRDGSLARAPTCTSQRGDNDSNRPQLALHCERAIRAVTLAAPFRDLPAQFYSQWRVFDSVFDRRLGG